MSYSRINISTETWKICRELEAVKSDFADLKKKKKKSPKGEAEMKNSMNGVLNAA